jgi:hypothetical protein
VLKEYPIQVNIPQDVPIKRTSYINRGEVYLSRDGYFYVVYDIGSGLGLRESQNVSSSGNVSFGYTTINRTGEFQKASYLICQKFNKDFQPAGPSFSLMDNSIPGLRYTTHMLYNEDSTQFILYQSEEYNDGQLTFAAGQARIFLYDQSFKLQKTFKLEEYHQFKYVTVRALSFSKNTISLLANNCHDCSRWSAKVNNTLQWININSKNGTSVSAFDEKYFSGNNLKPKYYKFLPGKAATYCVVMLNDRDIEKEPSKSNTFQLLQMKEDKIVTVQEWQMDKQTSKMPEGNTFCFDDIFGQGILDILPMPDNKGYYLIASRDYIFCACDNIKGPKKWQYFFVMTLGPDGKFIKQKFFPIHKPEKAYEVGKANILYKVSGADLIVQSFFSKEYYVNSKPADDNTMDKVNAVLIISPELDARFAEVLPH